MNDVNFCFFVICPSISLCVKCISPIFFEVGIPNLVCGCILGKQTKAAVHSKVVVLLLLTFCLLLLPLWKSVIVLCFVVRYYMSILVLQSS